MSIVNCYNVYVKDTGGNKGLGVFAKFNISCGDIVEKGVARRVDTDGNNNQFLFTWSEDKSVWAFCSGCATFYNTSLDPNTRMDRDFENDTFTIYALKDISKHEELTHKYRSLEWRKCFNDLNHNLNINQNKD